MHPATWQTHIVYLQAMQTDSVPTAELLNLAGGPLPEPPDLRSCGTGHSTDVEDSDAAPEPRRQVRGGLCTRPYP